MILKTGVLRGVNITKNGDLDIKIRLKGEPDAGFTEDQFKLLRAYWNDNILVDVDLNEAADGA